MIPYVTAEEREETRQLAIRYRRRRIVKIFMFGFTAPIWGGIILYVFSKFIELTGAFGVFIDLCCLTGLLALLVNEILS